MKKRHFSAAENIMMFFCIIILLPFALIFSQSIDFGGYTVKAYADIFRTSGFFNSFALTLICSAVTAFLGSVLMSMLGYVLYAYEREGKRGLAVYVYFSALFAGSMVPAYILYTNWLHINNTIWVYILPGIISPWYVFIMKCYTARLDTDLYDSAMIDGADEFGFFFKIVLPCIKPAVLSAAFLIFDENWNDWYTSMMFVDNRNLITIQYFLQNTVMNAQIETQNTVEMAAAVLTMLPVITVFPLCTKYRTIIIGKLKY